MALAANRSHGHISTVMSPVHTVITYKHILVHTYIVSYIDYGKHIQ